ncbi:MAG: N-acetylmuramoyl-L-alanine amidase, partial [Eggerthellaceae bacterium]
MNQYLKKPLFYTTVFLFTLVIAAFVCVSVPQYAYADGEALDSSNQAAVTDQNVLADDLLENENNQESTTTGGGEESGIGSDTGDSSGENVAGDSSNVSNTQTTTDTQASDGIDTAVNASVNSIVSTTKTAMAKTSSKSGFVVAIDAGHGGSDSGAVANGLKEKDLTLKIALYARDYLLENFPGITVYMTRTTDVYLGLSERVANAVANGADLFFCIHINAGGGNGVEVWTLNDSSYRYDLYTESYKLSQAYLKQTDKLSLKNRGIKTRDSEHGVTYPDGSTADYLTVLYRSRLAGIPAVLTENLFIDNASNASYLSNEANLKKLGIANAKAIIEYLSASPHPSVSATANGQLTLSWTAVPGATKYAIARKTSSGYYTYTYNCTNTSYTITGLTNGSSYSFLVQAYVGGSWTKFTSNDLLTVKLVPSPSNVKATPSGDGVVTLTWNAVNGATKYAIAEKLSTGKYKNFSTTYTGTSFTVDNLSNGKSHRFLVQAYITGTWSPVSEDLLVSATPTGTMKPAPTVSSMTDTSVTLSWKAVPGATKYAIARKTSSGYSTYTYDCTDTKYTINNLKTASTYTFLVQAYIDGAWSKFTTSDLVSVVVTGSAPTNVKATASGDGEVTLTWNAVKGATKYAVAEKLSSGKYKTSSNAITSTTYTVSDLANGKTHQFLVQAYVNGTWSPASDFFLVSATPTGTVKPAVSAVPKVTSVELSWGSVPGATKYAVARKTSSGYYNYTLDCTDTTYTVT